MLTALHKRKQFVRSKNVISHTYRKKSSLSRLETKTRVWEDCPSKVSTKTKSNQKDDSQQNILSFQKTDYGLPYIDASCHGNKGLRKCCFTFYCMSRALLWWFKAYQYVLFDCKKMPRYTHMLLISSGKLNEFQKTAPTKL